MARLLPIAAWLPRYRASRLSGDGIGALTAWAIVVPESVAYAEIAGVPPQNAFYAAPAAPRGPPPSKAPAAQARWSR